MPVVAALPGVAQQEAQQLPALQEGVASLADIAGCLEVPRGQAGLPAVELPQAEEDDPASWQHQVCLSVWKPVPGNLCEPDR